MYEDTTIFLVVEASLPLFDKIRDISRYWRTCISTSWQRGVASAILVTFEDCQVSGVPGGRSERLILALETRLDVR